MSYGASVSGSVNVSKIQSDYGSVQEQSAVRAGDGGFQVNVAGNTDLKGAVISSSANGAAASSLVTGTLTHSDLENYSKMSAASVGVGASATSAGTGNGDARGTGQGVGGSNLIDFAKSGSGGGVTGLAATSNNETSSTLSGVGAGAIVIPNGAAQQAATGQTAGQVVAELNRQVVTGTDTSGRIGNSLDVAAVHADLEITSAFGASVGSMLTAEAAKTVGDIGEARRNEAEAAERNYTRLADQAAGNGDASEAARYSALALEQKNSAAAWGDNGVNRIALHAGAQGLIGGLSGGSAGALASVSGVVGGNVGQQLGEYLGAERANALGLTSLGAGCGVAVLGVGVAGLSAKQAYDGNAALFGPYVSTEGARVLASFGTSTYPGEASPIKDALTETAKFGVIAAAGKLVPKALSAIEGEAVTIKQSSTAVPTRSTRTQVDGANSTAKTASSVPLSVADKIDGPVIKAVAEMNFSPGNLKFSDSMSSDQYKKLVKSIEANGIQNKVITYVEIEGLDYIAIGNNRYMAAQRTGALEQLRFQKSDFPVPGTNWYLPQDILDASGTVKIPKIYPKK